MKSNELRIWNWVETSEGVIQIQNGWEIDEGNECQPIPLTEEWLLKFGFEKEEIICVGGLYVEYHLKANSDVYMVYLNDFSVGLYASKREYENELAVIPTHDNVKHVHSLQNLYFALTGTELEIKEQ